VQIFWHDIKRRVANDGRMGRQEHCSAVSGRFTSLGSLTLSMRVLSLSINWMVAAILARGPGLMDQELFVEIG